MVYLFDLLGSVTASASAMIVDSSGDYLLGDGFMDALLCTFGISSRYVTDDMARCVDEMLGYFNVPKFFLRGNKLLLADKVVCTYPKMKELSNLRISYFFVYWQYLVVRFVISVSNVSSAIYHNNYLIVVWDMDKRVLVGSSSNTPGVKCIVSGDLAKVMLACYNEGLL